jgi:predicted TIM-barrel fold metal-dependent hydrolase
MKIDFHTHVFSPDIINNREKYLLNDPLFAELYANPKARLATADELISSMDEQGIEKSVILNINWHNMDLCIKANDYIIESLSRYPQRLIGFCMVRLDDPDGACKELERCIRAGIKGVGEVRPEEAILKNLDRADKVIRYIIQNNLILLTHTSEPAGHFYPGKGNNTPELIYPLIVRYPQLNLVCAHWGGGLPFYALMPEVKKNLCNVYFDTAASPFLYSPDVYKIVTQLVDPRTILFGSDYPLLKAVRLIREIQTSGISEETVKKILGENACRLLKLY